MMRVRWSLFLVPPLLVSLVLFVAPQMAFVRGSLLHNLGYGQTGSTPTLENYVRFFTDAFYQEALLRTAGLSLIDALVCLAVGLPIAYRLARSRSRWRSMWLTLVVASSLVTVVIKALGMMVLLSANGPVNQAALGLGLVREPLRLLNNDVGVVLGLIHYTLPLVILILFSVVQTIPEDLEAAARTLGAPPARVMVRVVLPLALPGLVAASLMAFNLAMGAFTSTALLGGGRVLTLPVLIQRKAVLEVDYPFAATISVVLLASGVLLNVLVLRLAMRLRRGAPAGVVG
jgi:putative spermidine/putrescine transport system permease protein